MHQLLAGGTLFLVLLATGGPRSQAPTSGAGRWGPASEEAWRGAGGPAIKEDWPQWRGPNGAGVSNGTFKGTWTPGTNIAWKTAIPGRGHSSPVVINGRLYLTTAVEGEPSDAGLMICIDAKTGAVKYEGGRPPVPATFRASPVAFDGKLLITSEDGDTFVIKAGPAHEVIRTNSVDEPVWASPALANGTIYIRGARHLFAIR